MDQWDLYDMEHVTFVPKGMTPEKLQEGFEWLNSSFLSWRSIFQRLFKIQSSAGEGGTAGREWRS